MAIYQEEKQQLCDLFTLLKQAENKVTVKQLENGGYSDPVALLETYKLSQFEMKTENAAVNCHPFDCLEISDNGTIAFSLSDPFIKLLNLSSKWEISDIQNHPVSDTTFYSLHVPTTGKAAKPIEDVEPTEAEKKRKLIMAGVAGGSLVLLLILFVAVSFMKRPKVESYKAFLTEYLTQMHNTETISLLKLEDIDKEAKHTYNVTYSFVTGHLTKEQEDDSTERTFKRIWVALQPIENDQVAEDNKEPLNVFVVREYKHLPLTTEEE